MSLKRIEMDWQCGLVYNIFIEACNLALQHSCNDVVFVFNEGIFSVSRSSVWNEEVNTKLQEYPRKKYEVKL